MTVLCPDAAVGDTGVVDEVTYTKRDRAGLDALLVVNDNNPELATTCTSGIEDMNGMFNGASSFNQNISNWNTNQVTNMGFMFQGATDFDQYLSGWCVGAVTISSSFDIDTPDWTLPESRPPFGIQDNCNNG